MAIDWKKEAVRWRRAYWAAVDDDDFKEEVRKTKKSRKKPVKKAVTKKAGKKTGLNKPVPAGEVYKKLGVKMPAKKKPARRKKRSGDLFDFEF